MIVRLALVMVLVALAAAPAQAASWVSAGPAPAHIDSLAFDPARPGVVYAGTIGGDLWRSGDGGGTWSAVAIPGDERVAAIAVRGDRIVLSRPGPAFSGIGGISRSADGGATWLEAGSAQGITNTDTGSVAIDPFEPDTVLLGTNGGLFRSTNAGASWSPVAVPTGTQIGDLVFDPAQAGRVFAGTSNQGVSRSADHGASFQSYNAPASPGQGSAESLLLDAGTLYAGSFQRLISTPVAGASAWVDASNGFAGPGWFVSGLARSGSRLLAVTNLGLRGTSLAPFVWGPLAGPGFSVGALAADPASTASVLAGGDGLARSADGGQTWEPVRPELPGLGVDAVVATAAGSALLTTASGLRRTDDLGRTFSRSAAGLSSAVRGRPAVAASDPSRVLVATADGLAASSDGGRTWTPRAFASAARDHLAIAPSDPQRVYVAGFSGAVGLVRRSTDGGVQFEDANSTGAGGAQFNFSRGLAVDAADPLVAYLSTGEGLRVTANGGDTWSPGGGLPPGATGAVTADPGRAGVAYLVAAEKVWRTADRGATWAPLPALPDGVPTDVLPDPGDPQVLYAATTRGVARSADGGATWAAFSDGLPNRRVNGLAIDRARAAVLAATDGGLAVASLVVPPGPGVPPPSGAPPPAAGPRFRASAAFALPSARRCLKRPPRLTLRWLRPKGVVIDRVEVLIGKRRIVRNVGTRARRTLKLTKLPARAFTLTLRVTPRGAPAATVKRSYRVCARKALRR
jgi:photosystem II stability/assembly factor-like uncharacterized protein